MTPGYNREFCQWCYQKEMAERKQAKARKRAARRQAVKETLKDILSVLADEPELYWWLATIGSMGWLFSLFFR